MAIETDDASDFDAVGENWHRRPRPTFIAGVPIPLTRREAQVVKDALIAAGLYAGDVIRELPGGLGQFRFNPWHNAEEAVTFGRAGDRAPEPIPQRRLQVLRELIVEAEVARYPTTTVDSLRGNS
jgi:hypothetical protein